MTFESVLKNNRADAFRHGIVFVEDFEGYGWKNFSTKVTIKSDLLTLSVQWQQALTEIITDRWPVSYKLIAVLHPPAIMKPVLAIIKFFTKKKLLDRVTCFILKSIDFTFCRFRFLRLKI